MYDVSGNEITGNEDATVALREDQMQDITGLAYVAIDGNQLRVSISEDNIFDNDLGGQWIKVSFDAMLNASEVESGDLGSVEAEYNKPVLSDEDHKGITNWALCLVGDKIIESNTVTVMPEKPQVEKYVNKAVHKDIELNEVFVYDIIGYVPKYAEKVEFIDKLNKDIEFGEEDVWVNYLDTNNHLPFYNVSGEVANSNASVSIVNLDASVVDPIISRDNNTLTVTINDAKPYRGKYIRVTFFGQIKKDIQDKINAGEKTIVSLSNEEITKNGDVISTEEHSGIPNQAQMTVYYDNNEKNDTTKSNVVTVSVDNTIDIKVNKVWKDDENNDGLRPDVISITLLADGEVYDTARLTENTDWSHTFTDLPKYNETSEIKYTIVESEVKGYTYAVEEKTGEELDNDKIEELDQPIAKETKQFVITNTHEIEKVEVTVTKTWKDNDDQDGIRPDTIDVTLKGSDGKTYSATLSKDDNWSYTFKDLPKYLAGEEITYTVSETEVEGYEVSVEEYNITNTHETEKINISGKKFWFDNNDEDGIRPESIIVKLLADGTVNRIATVTEEDDWAYSFNNLDKYANGKEIKYTVDEENVPGYVKEVSGYDLINTHKVEEPTKTVNGKQEHVITDKKEDIVFSISQVVPEGCKEMVFTDEISDLLEIYGLEIDVADVDLDISKQNIKVVLNENHLKDLGGELITLKITTRLKEGADEKVLADGITNTGKVEVDGALKVTNTVKVRYEPPKKETPKKYTAPKTGVE